jgi:hypothetical protein
MFGITMLPVFLFRLSFVAELLTFGSGSSVSFAPIGVLGHGIFIILLSFPELPITMSFTIVQNCYQQENGEKMPDCVIIGLKGFLNRIYS